MTAWCCINIPDYSKKYGEFSTLTKYLSTINRWNEVGTRKHSKCRNVLKPIFTYFILKKYPNYITRRIPTLKM